METFTTSYNTILKAMQNKFGVENIIYEPGVTYAEKEEWYVENTPEIEKVIEKAGAADYIMVCIGENSYAETTGNINDLNLSHNQKSLVKAVQTVGKPVILILNQGRPRLISDLVPDAQAVVNIMLPGNYGGDALADLQVMKILVDVCLLLILHIPILLQPMTLRCARIGKQCLVFTTTKRIQMCNGGLERDLVILNSTIVISE